jgi:hypothetical protein
MTAFAKKAAFCRTSPYSWDASAPETVAVNLKSTGVLLADLTQSPRLFCFPIAPVHRIGQVSIARLARQVGHVPGKVLVRLFVRRFGIAFDQ